MQLDGAEEELVDDEMENDCSDDGKMLNTHRLHTLSASSNVSCHQSPAS